MNGFGVVGWYGPFWCPRTLGITGGWERFWVFMGDWSVPADEIYDFLVFIKTTIFYYTS